MTGVAHKVRTVPVAFHRASTTITCIVSIIVTKNSTTTTTTDTSNDDGGRFLRFGSFRTQEEVDIPASTMVLLICFFSEEVDSSALIRIVSVFWFLLLTSRPMLS